MKPTTVLAAGAGAGAAVLAIRQLERWCDRDECWLALADRIRRQLPPPPQSSFRVVAVVALGSAAASAANLAEKKKDPAGS